MIQPRGNFYGRQAWRGGGARLQDGRGGPSPPSFFDCNVAAPPRPNPGHRWQLTGSHGHGTPLHDSAAGTYPLHSFAAARGCVPFAGSSRPRGQFYGHQPGCTFGAGTSLRSRPPSPPTLHSSTQPDFASRCLPHPGPRWHFTVDFERRRRGARGHYGRGRTVTPAFLRRSTPTAANLRRLSTSDGNF